MIAARFRSVYWVAIALLPALLCYLATQRVAAERDELAKVERAITRTRLDIRNLETELGTRASMAQLERWNSETLNLVAPGADHYVSGNVLLASLAGGPLRVAPVVAPPQVAAPVQVGPSSPEHRRQRTEIEHGDPKIRVRVGEVEAVPDLRQRDRQRRIVETFGEAGRGEQEEQPPMPFVETLSHGTASR